MMSLTDPETVEACRERAGNADSSRPEEIDEALDRPRLGHGEGDPLVGESYSGYPSDRDLTDPKWREFLIELLSHRAVNSWQDASEELSISAGSIQNAAEVYGIDADELLGGEEWQPQDQLKSILGHAHVDGTQSLVVAELYVAGLSVAEIAEVTEAQNVTDILKNLGLLGGKTTEEGIESFQEREGRLSSYGDRVERARNSANITVE